MLNTQFTGVFECETGANGCLKSGGLARNRAYGLELSHDVAALSIKGSSIILNFSEGPRLVSLSPRDVQVATAKAAAMQKFDLIETPSSSSSSSMSSLVSAIDLSTTYEKLSQIVELPSLGSYFNSLELRNDFVYIENMWFDLDPPPPLWLCSGNGGGAADVENMSCFESLL
ncbi:Dehydration-responsive element-binding protein 3 [Abeliophyllum distichum]|uniref:Dehydration-responsive element-binding protein 3 n=1 Tax=Abeliophyllum distichum TaxID=126358 RepID=A0ABD1VSL7_9LAMI